MEGSGRRTKFRSEAGGLQGRAGGDIGRCRSACKKLTSFKGCLFFSLFQLNRGEGKRGIFAIGILALGCQNGLVTVFRGLILLEGFEASCGEIGCSQANTRLLGFAGGEIELDGGGLVKVFHSEDFAEAVGPCCSKLAGLKLHEKLFVSGTGGDSVSCHSVALGQTKEGHIAGWRGGVRNQKRLILRNGQIVELARVEIVCAIQRRVRMRTHTACGRDANVLRVIQNGGCGSGLRGCRNWRRFHCGRWNSLCGSGWLHRLRTANFHRLTIRQAIHPGRVLIVIQRRGIRRQRTANFLSIANGTKAQKGENRSPLHC